MLDVVVFDVEHGQSIFFYPQDHPEYGMFVDCGNTPSFEPIDDIKDLLPKNSLGKPILGNLILTNYDHDHFSGLPYLREAVQISTIRFAKNISTQELIAIKDELTEALTAVCQLKNSYIYDTPSHTPPYNVTTFSLPRHCFPGETCDTNNLSQVVFVNYGGSIICIAGDLGEDGWLQLLQQPNFRAHLSLTNIFVAAHHGRESGYAEEIFNYCSPECIILSDKKIMHGTQEGMVQAYSKHVAGNGIRLANQGLLIPAKKVLTTRNEGHIWMRFSPAGGREYRNIRSQARKSQYANV